MVLPWVMAGQVVNDLATRAGWWSERVMGGQFDLRAAGVGALRFRGNVRMYVRVFCASAALEVPLKQERGVGGGRGLVTSEGRL